MSQLSQHDLINDLKDRLRALEHSCRRTQSTACSTGIAGLDQLLPAGGLVQGSLVEWLSDGEGAGAATLALTVAARVLQDGGALVVIDARREFYSPAAAGLGVALERMVLVRPANARDALWALEQALRCRSVAATLGWIETLDDRVFRRLQLAAETGGGLGFLLRPAARRGQPSWADVRLLVQALPPAPHAAGRRLRVELLPGRGTAGGKTVDLEQSDETGHVSVAAALADSALSVRASGA